MTETGALPGGVTFTDNGDGTATLAGTPAANSAGVYPLTLTASNGDQPDSVQSFTFTVGQKILAFIQPPGSITTGQTISPIVVAIEDQDGNIVHG